MNIDDYKYITTIAEFGSLTSAATKLFIAQPSLSQRVKHIEGVYGITIFIREAQGMHLTAEGECFVRYANQILNSEEKLREEIADMHDLGSNMLRIGTTQFINSHLFDSLIHRFHEKHLLAEYEFIERPSLTLQQLLLSGKIDIAVCYLPIISPELKYKVICSDRFVLVPAKGSTLEEKIRAQTEKPGSYVNIELLDGEPFAIPTPGTRLHQCVMSIQEKGGIQPDIQHFGKHFSMLYSIAKKGIASTILYESFFNPLQEHEPYYYLEGISNNDLSIAVAWRKGTYLRNAAREFTEIAREINEEGNIQVDI